MLAAALNTAGAHAAGEPVISYIEIKSRTGKVERYVLQPCDARDLAPGDLVTFRQIGSDHGCIRKVRYRNGGLEPHVGTFLRIWSRRR